MGFYPHKRGRLGKPSMPFEKACLFTSLTLASSSFGSTSMAATIPFVLSPGILRLPFRTAVLRIHADRKPATSFKVIS